MQKRLKLQTRMAISRDSTFDPVKFLILIYPSKIVSPSNWAKQRYKCFKIVFNKIVSLGEILARLKWVSMIGDRTFPRIYCARNDAAKGPRNASLCECSLDSRTLCSYYHAGLYSAQWSPSRTEFSTVLLSYDIPCPYHILVYSPSFLSHFIFVTRRIFTGRKKKIFLPNSIEKSILRIYFHRFFHSIDYTRLYLAILATILHA